MPATIPLLQEGRYSIEQEFPYVENCLLFQAYDTQAERPVTIVEVPHSLSRSATAAERDAATALFNGQAERLASIKHPGVVSVRSFFIESGRTYLVTDPVEGVDLASMLADQNRPFSVSEVTGWADTLLDALHAMHQSRPPIVFRGLRPENIVLRGDGTVQLIVSGSMFGRETASAGGGSPLAFSPLEQIWSGLDAATQRVIISKYDEASEKILKQEPDARSDIFSLGATLYKLVTGRTPADALERSIEMIEGNADPLVSPNKLDAAIPVEVSDVIMKALGIRREYRFDSAAIMRQVLKTALVRVKEREAEEALVRKVEGHDVSEVLQSTPDTKASTTGLPGAPASSQPPAETKPAANTHVLQTDAGQVGRRTETFDLAELEDDLLGLLDPSPHTSQAPNQRVPESPATDEPVLKSDAEAVSEPQVVKTHAAEPEPVLHSSDDEEAADSSEPAGEYGAQPEETAAAPALSSSEASELFTEHKASRGFGMPAMAAAAVVLVIAAVGGWFYFGSNAAPAASVEPPAAAQSVQSQPPQQTEEPAARTSFQSGEPSSPATAVQPTPDQTVAGQQPAAETQDDPARPERTSPAAVKPKKPAPAQAKAPSPKKAVTVDDLINDN